MKEAELKTLIREIAGPIREFVAEEITKALASVEPRLKAMETRPALEHVGAWKAATIYGPMQMVQRDNCCWLCLRETSSQPPGEAWRLIARTPR